MKYNRFNNIHWYRFRFENIKKNFLDITKGNRDLKSILSRYHKYVKLSFEDFILLSRKYEDIIIPKIRDNSPIFQIVTEYLRIHLNNYNIVF